MSRNLFVEIIKKRFSECLAGQLGELEELEDSAKKEGIVRFTRILQNFDRVIVREINDDDTAAEKRLQEDLSSILDDIPVPKSLAAAIKENLS